MSINYGKGRPSKGGSASKPSFIPNTPSTSRPSKGNGGTSGGNIAGNRPSGATTGGLSNNPSSGSSTSTRPVEQNRPSGGSSGGGSSGGSYGGSSSGSSNGSSSGGAVAGGSSSPGRDYYAEYESAIRAQQEAEEARLREQIRQAVAQVEGLRPGIQQQYDGAAQQAYIQKMLSQRDMGQQLAANGLSGGMAESSILGLENSYGQNLNSLEQARQNALQGLDSDIAGIRASGNISLAENANQHATRLQEAIWQAQQAQLASDEKIAGINAEAQKALVKSYGSGSSGSYKPRLTYNQLWELYNSGDTSQDVVDGLNYYRPGFLAGSESNGRLDSLNQFMDAASNAVGNIGLPQEGVKQKAIQQLVSSGQITPAEARQLAAMYGIPLTGM